MENKQKFTRHIVFVAYIILSALFIGYTLWQNVQTNLIDRYFTAGQTETINALITQAQNPNCQPFSVYNEQTQVQVVNVACLQTADSSAGQEVAE